MSSQPHPVHSEPAITKNSALQAAAPDLTSQYNQAASGKREKEQLRGRAPRVKQAFQTAHEGPRERLAEPHLQADCQPSPAVVAAVHKQHDEMKRWRNREKDEQMQAWREAKISTSRHFNTVAMCPPHLREQIKPEVLSQHNPGDALKQRLQQKRDQTEQDHR